MKKRWKVPFELQYFEPYEAGDDKSHKQVIMELEYILKKYKAWPNDRHIQKAKKKADKQKNIEQPVVDKVVDGEENEIEPIEPVNEYLDLKELAGPILIE